MGGRRPARRGFFRAGAVEPHAVFRRPRVHAVAAIVFYDTASAVQSRAGAGSRWPWFRARRERRNSAGLLEKIFAKFFWLDRDSRALAVKDLRMFWRDTTQWGQSVMLFGLLGVYIINLRNFTHQLTSAFWVNLVAFLNLVRVLVEPGHGDDAVCVPAIFARRPAAVDRRHGADGAGARRQNQILAGQHDVAGRDLRPHHAVVLSAENVVGPRGVFRRGHHA